MFARSNVYQEEKDRRARERRQQAEAQRLQRIMNPKLRCMGVDTEALDHQVKEKKCLQELEKERDIMFDDLRLMQDRQALYFESLIQRQRTAAAAADDEFRQRYQKCEQRREYDLSDPDALKKDHPARESDDDPRCGPSSMQIFEGEDLGCTERIRQQQLQLEAWTAQELEELKRRKEREHMEDRLFEQRQEELNFRAQEIEQAVREAKAEMAHAVRNYNLIQAQIRRQKEEEEKEREIHDDLEEIRNTLNDPRLNEKLDTTISCSNPLRFRPDHFKGLRPDQHAAILEEQERQRKEHEQALAREREEEERWAAYQENMKRNADVIERQIARTHAEVSRQVAEQNRLLAEEKKKRYDVLYNQVYKNEVTDDFFNRFGCSAR